MQPAAGEEGQGKARRRPVAATARHIEDQATHRASPREAFGGEPLLDIQRQGSRTGRYLVGKTAFRDAPRQISARFVGLEPEVENEIRPGGRF
jgi:hypothetical protein